MKSEIDEREESARKVELYLRANRLAHETPVRVTLQYSKKPTGHKFPISSLLSHSSSQTFQLNIQDDILQTSYFTQANPLSPLSGSPARSLVGPKTSTWSSNLVGNSIKISNTYSKTQEDFIEFKQARAKSRALICLVKKRSWCSYIISINKPVSFSTI